MSDNVRESSSAVQVVFDPGSEPHDPHLYDYEALADGVSNLDDIGPEQVEQYRRDGYLVVHHLLSDTQIAGACAGLSNLIACRGKTRYQLMFERSVRDRIDQLTDAQREEAIRKVFQFHGADERLDAISGDPKLLSVIDRLGVTEPKLFQSMALLKGPGGREKPWHQDHAYFDTPLENRVVGVWIALDRATPENGCMMIIPGRQHEPFLHWKRRDWQICDTDIQQVRDRRLAVQLEPGGALLFDSLLPHGTPTNQSAQRRRALQFHYAPGDAGTLTTQQRLAIFGSEGKNVTC